MYTIDSIVSSFFNFKGRIKEIKEILRTLDPHFPAEEAKFQEACKRFLACSNRSLSPTAQDYLNALEQSFVSSVIYIAGQGFKLNLDIFNNPAISLFLTTGEFEDITRERMLASVPGVQRATETIQAFYDTVRELPAAEAAEILELMDSITDLYAYLETVGYKLAHYFGFVLADGLLSCLVPGYQRDIVITLQYQRMLRDYLEIDISKL